MTPQQIKALKLALEALKNNKPTHLYCEDIWYSCPKHEDGCANEREGDECNCGADEINAEFDKAIPALEEALADHAMQEVQRLGQEIEQEPVVWPCLIDSADFSENTITLVMQCKDYKVSAGTHWLSTTQPKEKNT